MTTNTGGPAFPRNILDHGHGVSATHQSGMTLRDYFAAKAMQGLIVAYADDRRDVDANSERAYEVADAMLKAREA